MKRKHIVLLWKAEKKAVFAEFTWEFRSQVMCAIFAAAKRVYLALFFYGATNEY